MNCPIRRSRSGFTAAILMVEDEEPAILIGDAAHQEP
jgi:hypothetical protein